MKVERTAPAPSRARVGREVGGEASAGEDRPAIEPRKIIPGADDVPVSEGEAGRREKARTVRPGVVLDPGMCSSSPRGNRKILVHPGRSRRRIASGRRGAVAGDERAGEVRPRHSSAERPTNEAERSGSEPASQGRGPRGMRSNKARTGRRTGEACHRRWTAYGKPQGERRRRSIMRSSTLSASSGLEDGVPRTRGGRRRRRGWADMDGVRGDPRAQARGPARPGSTRAYRATPSRRVYIPKPDGGQRPLAVAAWRTRSSSATGRGVEHDLRGGFPRVQPRLSAWARGWRTSRSNSMRTRPG